MLLALLVALAATPDAAPAVGAAPSTTPPPAVAPAAPAKSAQKAADSEVICKTEQVTGSIFPKKVCRRKSDAEAARADQQQNLRDVQHVGGALHH